MKPVCLRIRLQVQQQDVLRYSFELPGSTWMPAVAAPYKEVSRSAQEQLVRRLLGAAQAGEGERELQERAHSLSVLLVPPAVRRFLAQLDSPLLLDIDHHEVPWEFLHDGETFL